MNDNGHLDGNTRLDVAVEDNPYYPRRRREEKPNPEFDSLTQKTGAVTVDDGVGPAVEVKPKSDRKRWLAFAGALLVLLAAGGGFLYFQFGRTTKIEHQIKAKPGLSAQIGQGRMEQTDNESPDQQTLDAIKQSQEARRAGGAPAQGETAPSVEPAPQVIPSMPKLQIPGEYVEPQAGRGSDATADNGAPGAVPIARYKTRGAPAHGSSSVYAGEPVKAATSRPPEAAPNARPTPGIARIEKATPLPPYGEMLPVRTLGGLYPLRNSLARLELTRNVSGKGWELKKGTVFVARVQGSALDRAYLAVSGFIDPGTNRYVKITGETLGSDGSPGLKGKRRQVSSRWSRVGSRILNGALTLGQAAIARGGGTTVVVGSSGLTNDLALINTISNKEFVEVEAGASGYVMVADLPETRKGVDADPTGEPEGNLSDEELAELLSSGDPAKIRAAMPRMTPEMRKVAEMVVKEK
jgi:hypothetical protein